MKIKTNLFDFSMCVQSVNLFPDDLGMLFGEDCEATDAFAQVDKDNDGEVRCFVLNVRFYFENGLIPRFLK